MSPLCRAPASVHTADGTLLRLACLDVHGLDALFARGWAAMREEIGEPDCWFLSERLYPTADGALHVSSAEPFLVDAPPSAADAGAHLLYVHPSVRGFDGHFPGRPILPGVVQVDWAARLAARSGYPSERFAGLSRLKFAAPVRPGAMLRLSLMARGSTVDYRFDTGDGIAASGCLHYRD